MAAPVNNVPSFSAKATLTTGRVLQSAFDTPAKMTVSAAATGATTTNLVGGVNAALRDSIAALNPRGPAKWLDGLFAKVDTAAASSVEQAKKATDLFWAPLSEGSMRTGNAVSFPFAASYASKVGLEIPADSAAADAFLKDLITSKGFPVPEPEAPPEGEPAPTPPGEEAPAPTPPGDGSPAPTPPGDEAPAPPTDDAPAPPSDEAPAPPTDDVPAPPSDEAPAPPTDEAPAPPTDEAPAPPAEEAPAPPTEDAPPAPTEAPVAS